SFIFVVLRGKFRWRMFLSALYETGRTSAMILFIVVGATAFTGVFNITGGLSAVQELMRSLDMAPWALIIVMLLVVFVL
ncbi:TRAP transporter large permease subunit, partial [Micrococcus luteus]|nr:TRAP transporter large permease subunit [Micrococcus luteus]